MGGASRERARPLISPPRPVPGPSGTRSTTIIAPLPALRHWPFPTMQADTPGQVPNEQGSMLTDRQ
jgi:hypothetical protein